MRVFGGVTKELICKTKSMLLADKVNGKVSLKLYKGNIISISKESSNSLYNESQVSFEEEGGFSNEDMKNHIKLNILRF